MLPLDNYHHLQSGQGCRKHAPTRKIRLLKVGQGCRNQASTRETSPFTARAKVPKTPSHWRNSPVYSPGKGAKNTLPLEKYHHLQPVQPCQKHAPTRERPPYTVRAGVPKTRSHSRNTTVYRPGKGAKKTPEKHFSSSRPIIRENIALKNREKSDILALKPKST